MQKRGNPWIFRSMSKKPHVREGDERGGPALDIRASDLTPSPLGRVTLLAAIHDGLGIQPPLPMRIYPDYAWVLITEGKGRYRDVRGRDLPVSAGDAILVFPGLAHTYGPLPGTRWNEIYVVFNGPVFDAWQSLGVLSPSEPVRRLPPDRDWTEDFISVFEAGDGQPDSIRRSLQVCRLLTILTEGLAGAAPAAASSPAHWTTRAFAMLSSTDDPKRPVTEIAEGLGMSVETFRRRFRAETGQSPARWRADRHLETACHWMRYTQLTSAQIAARLGFSDEFHFSRRFSQLRGQSPSEFRRQNGM